MTQTISDNDDDIEELGGSAITDKHKWRMLTLTDPEQNSIQKTEEGSLVTGGAMDPPTSWPEPQKPHFDKLAYPEFAASASEYSRNGPAEVE